MGTIFLGQAASAAPSLAARLSANSLTVSNGQTVVLGLAHLNAADADTPPAQSTV